MCRCKACDSVMDESEIIWRAVINQWEDLCSTCRVIIHLDEIEFMRWVDREKLSRSTQPEEQQP